MFLETLKIVFDHTSTKYKVHALPIDTWNLAGEDNFNEPISLCAPKPRMPYGLGAYRIPLTASSQHKPSANAPNSTIKYTITRHKAQHCTHVEWHMNTHEVPPSPLRPPRCPGSQEGSTARYSSHIVTHYRCSLHPSVLISWKHSAPRADCSRPLTPAATRGSSIPQRERA